MPEVFLRTTANKAGYVAVRVRNATGEVVLPGASGECAECGEEVILWSGMF